MVTSLPGQVHFRDLDHERSIGLSAVIGHDGTAPVVADLVAAGPHAVVGGTTGAVKANCC